MSWSVNLLLAFIALVLTIGQLLFDKPILLWGAVLLLCIAELVSGRRA